MPAAPDVSRTERRTFPRSDVIGTQLVSVDIKPQSSSALLLDVSEGGLALQNLAAMRPGGTREFSFRLPGNGIGIRGSAIVVWKQGDRAGLRFTHLEESSRRVLRGWVQSLPQSRPNRKTPPGSHIEHPPAPYPVNHVQPPEVGKPPLSPFQEFRDEDFYSITARARVVTCATGAALAWEDADGMVCRASTGLAPAPGARVQLEQGLSGECVRTGGIVRCDDTEKDPRVAPEVCRQLNLRSAIIVPVIREGKVTGLIEVFSNKPAAFRNEDVENLKLLAEQCSTQRSAAGDPITEPEPEGTPLRGFRPATDTRPLRSMKFRTVLPWIFGALVLIATATFTFRRSDSASAASRQAQQQSRADLATAETAAAVTARNGIPRDVTEAFFGKGDAAARTVIRKQRAQKAASKSGSEQDAGDAQQVLTPAEEQPAPPQQNVSQRTTASSPKVSDSPPPVLKASTASPSILAALDVPPPALPSGPAPAEITPARLLHSVKPRYPGSARAANVEGTVYLRIKLDERGHVKDVDVLSGRPDLVRAAVSAVRQWRYDPFKLNGKAINGEINVTVNFSLKH